jgi:chromosome segregation ATPase
VIFLPHFGFKTSFFGFNKDEVNAYIGHLMSSAKEKEKDFSEKATSLESKNKELTEKIEELEKNLAEMKGKVDYYSGKEAEIEKMSISIGTMYMVAKQNATEIVAAAEDCAKEISEHSRKQLKTADEANEKLNALMNELNSAAKNFSGNVLNMSEAFDDIKVRLENQLSSPENKPEIELTKEDL